VSEDLFRRASRVTPGGVHSPVRAFRAVGGTPFFTRRARGARLVDTGGREYLDFCMAFGPLVLGHAHPAVMQAAEAALRDGWSYGTADPYSLELAELITGRIPWAEQLRFVNSGTEAVMAALRLARGVTGRSKLLKFAGCYHGHADAMLIRAGSGLAGAGAADSAGVPVGVAADTLVAPLDDEAALGAVFAAHGAELAAAIIEPLPANHGLLPQRPEFLARLRELTRAHGALLIFDEVISGFRLRFDGYAGLCGVAPDLVTWGKVIGGGFPVGAVAGRRALMQEFAPLGRVYQAGTLSANPVAMRAGLATLQLLFDGSVYAELAALGEQLERSLVGSGLHLQRCGSLFWLPGGARRPAVLRTPAAFDASLTAGFAPLFQRLLAAGIYLPPSPFEVGFLSTAHTAADIGALAQALGAAR
jgi:glutamate-1-semialdehyde 2,1-aminomutase